MMGVYWLIGLRIGIMLVHLCVIKPLLFMMRITGAWYLLGTYLVMKWISTKFGIVFPDILVLIIFVTVFVWVMKVRFSNYFRKNVES